MIDVERARSTRLRETTGSLDQSEPAMAQQTLGAEFTNPVQRLDRYERNCLRRQQWARKKLEAAKLEEHSIVAAPQPKPASAQNVDLTPTPISRLADEIGDRDASEDLGGDEPEVATAPQPGANFVHRANRPGGMNRRQRRKLAALDRRACEGWEKRTQFKPESQGNSNR